MKKFSNITKEVINTEPPKLDKDPIDPIKNKLRQLIENNLILRYYGPIDRYYRAGQIRIEGKDNLIEAILNFLIDYTHDTEIKALESLKSDIKDWETIDNKIDKLKVDKKIIDKRTKGILERWDDIEVISYLINKRNK